jgi:hypothetical protein
MPDSKAELAENGGKSGLDMHLSRRYLLAKSPLLIAVACGLVGVVGYGQRSAIRGSAEPVNPDTAKLPPRPASAPVQTAYVFASDPRAGMTGFRVLPG